MKGAPVQKSMSQEQEATPRKVSKRSPASLLQDRLHRAVEASDLSLAVKIRCLQFVLDTIRDDTSAQFGAAITEQYRQP